MSRAIMGSDLFEPGDAPVAQRETEQTGTDQQQGEDVHAALLANGMPGTIGTFGRPGYRAFDADRVKEVLIIYPTEMEGSGAGMEGFRDRTASPSHTVS